MTHVEMFMLSLGIGGIMGARSENDILRLINNVIVLVVWTYFLIRSVTNIP